jgi:hypothetical protein
LKSIVIKYSIILLVAQLISWRILFYSPLNIPSHIPRTPIDISGLLLLSLITVIIILFQKEGLKYNKQISLAQLILTSGLVAFIAELVFQFIRFKTIIADTFNEKLFYALRGVIVIPLMTIIISIITALIIRRRNKPVKQ